MRLLINCPSGESRLLVRVVIRAANWSQCVVDLSISFPYASRLQQVDDAATVKELKHELQELEGRTQGDCT